MKDFLHRRGWTLARILIPLCQPLYFCHRGHAGVTDCGHKAGAGWAGWGQPPSHARRGRGRYRCLRICSDAVTPPRPVPLSVHFPLAGPGPAHYSGVSAPSAGPAGSGPITACPAEPGGAPARNDSQSPRPCEALRGPAAVPAGRHGNNI